MINDNPNLSPGIVDCSPYTIRIGLREAYHKKAMDIFAYTPVEVNYLEIEQRISSFLPNKSSSSKKTLPTMLQFVALLLQGVQTRHSLDRTLKIHSGTENFISDKLENMEVVSQS